MMYKVMGPRVVVVAEIDEESEDSPVEESSDEEDVTRWQDLLKESHGTDVNSDYWHIQKLFRYMKIGKQNATVIAICCLQEYDLKKELNQLAIKETGGLETLVNLLETNDMKCKLGALSILLEILHNPDLRRNITNLGGVPLLVKNLTHQAKDLQILAAEAIAKVAEIRKARRIIRKSGGIPKLVDLLDINPSALTTPMAELSPDDKQQVHVARAGAKALWSLSQSRRNKEAMRRTGCVRLLASLLKCCHKDVVIPIMGTLQQCATEHSYQLAIQTEGMVGDLVRHLSDESLELKKLCASAIFKCAAEDAVTRDLVRQHGGLDPLVKMAMDADVRADKPLLAAVTGAIWKLAITEQNVQRFEELRTVGILVGLLNDENDEVLTNVVGGLAECAKFPVNRESLRKAQGIPPLVILLNVTNPALLENVALVLGECANEMESMAIIEQLDGVRLIWSLLKNPSDEVKANAAWALCPCIQNAKDSGEMVRSFVGGLELIVSLLQSKNNRVLACVCAAISKIAQDRENLAVITDHNVVSLLASLVVTENDNLREHLAEAIASCCNWGDNRHEFGRLQAITPLVAYMASKNKNVHRTTAYALEQLSGDPFNCITMHQSGVVVYLLKTIGSSDEKLQEASAGCLSNIRTLALSAERFATDKLSS